ncbi:DUF1707 domain-containing protein [Streptomyces sp. NPDC047028]|uniref:DUF1707 SHOCT-like domain-containing protein n=1 Tax=Streptomyces sp. NPDC047028 TaxID=3155793 RepID=UPI0033EC6443
MTDDANPDLRASDADRERVAEVLRDALAEGRLDMAEFEERLEGAYRARTYGELAPLTRDLPVSGAGSAPAVSFVKEPAEPAVRGGWTGRIVGGEGSSDGAVAIMSGFQRKGRWTVPKRFTCFAFWGGGEIDLREADFVDREVEINCISIMGGMQVIVPPGVEVVVRGFGFMGGFEHPRGDDQAGPGAPRVVIGGFAFWGGVGVDRKVTRAERQRLKELRRQEQREGLDAGSARPELFASRHERRYDRHEHRELREEWREERRRDRERRRGRGY